MNNTIDPVTTSDGACVSALNTTRNRPLAGRVAVAATRASRAVGLLRAGCIGVLELPVGCIAESGTRLGDSIRFETT